MNTKSLNIFIYTFAIIGLVSILSSFNSKTQNYDTKVWTMVSSDVGGSGTPNMYVLNQQTGELRFFRASREEAMQPPK